MKMQRSTGICGDTRLNNITILCTIDAVTLSFLMHFFRDNIEMPRPKLPSAFPSLMKSASLLPVHYSLVSFARLIASPVGVRRALGANIRCILYS